MFKFMQAINTPEGPGLFIGFTGTQTLQVALKVKASDMSDEEIMQRKAILRTFDRKELTQALQEVKASSVFQINRVFNISDVQPIG
jgi:pantothenate kinase